MQTPPNLVPFGYAPGSYYYRCRYCTNEVWHGDKYGWSCQPCAEERWRDHQLHSTVVDRAEDR